MPTYHTYNGGTHIHITKQGVLPLQSNTENVNMKVKPHIKELLGRLARERGIGESTLARLIIEKYLAAHEDLIRLRDRIEDWII